LNNLFAYGGMTLEQGLVHTSDWRRSVSGSVDADLVETLLLMNWAYAARGTGSANTISGQAQQAYEYRNEMASAELREIENRSSSNPLWFQLELWLKRNQGQSLKT